jgi:hypothetical protein
VSGLSGDAIESAAQTIAKSGGMSRADHAKKLVEGLAEHTKFKHDVKQAMALMERVQGRIPDTARAMVSKGKVALFSEAGLMNVYGPVGANRYKKLAEKGVGGFYDAKVDIIFMSGSSPEDLAGTLIHEATYRVGSANPLRGNDFMSEACAEFAERDFYMLLYGKDGPLKGAKPASSRIQKFLTWSDEQLMEDIEARYYTAKENLPPERRQSFLNLANKSAEDVVKEIFDDIAADYKKNLPKSP